jgi:hypothetical protein
MPRADVPMMHSKASSSWMTDRMPWPLLR